MKELLERWARVEPGRCEYNVLLWSDDMGTWYGIRIARPEECGEFNHVEIPFFDDGHTIEWRHSVYSDIQGAVQQAIEARNEKDRWWDFEIITLWNRGPERFEARVKVGFSDRRTYKATADTPAAALLEAYLQAVEAAQAVEGGV